MSITEFATLEVLALPLDSNFVPNSDAQPAPLTLSSSIHLRDYLKIAAKEQSAVSGYPVVFFQSLLSSSVFYLISGWTSVSAHHTWIASQTNQELLARLTGFVGVKDFVHVDIDFDEMKGQLGLDSEPTEKGVLLVSDGKKEMPCKSLKCTWTREGESLDGDNLKGMGRKTYRFAWFPAGVEDSEDRSDVQAGDSGEILMMDRTNI